MTAPTRAEIIAKAADGRLLDALFNDYGRHWFNENDPIIVELAKIHNDGAVDLLALVTPASLEPYKGSTFFAGQHIYQALISKLNTSAESLMRVVDALLKAGGNDMMAGLPANEFAKWCAADPARPAELLGLIDRKVANADRYLTIAITSGVAVDAGYFTDRAYSFLTGGSEGEKLGAINALGQIPLANAAEWDRLVTTFQAALTPDPGDAIRAGIVTAMVRRLKDAPLTHANALIEIAIAAITPLGDQVLYESAQALAFHLDAVGPKLIETMLKALLTVKPQQKSTLHLLDLALTKLVKAGDPSRARFFLEHLFAREGEGFGFEQFDSFRHKLFETGGRVLEDWVVAWLRIGNFTLCKEMNDKLFGPGTDEIAFSIDFTRFGLADAEYAYLARKAIGSFFLKPLIMVSILTSLLRSAPDEPAREIEALLLDPILINYSGVASEYLKPITEDTNDVVTPAAKRALEGLTNYINGLKSIGEVAELHPSERERQLEWQRHSDSLAVAFRNARKNSIMASLMSESVMLYGSRAVTWVVNAVETPRRIETPLASIGIRSRCRGSIPSIPSVCS